MDEYFDFQAKPTCAWITVNRGCNFRCKWCYAQSSNFNQNDNMSLDMAKNLVLISKDIGVNSFVVIGGEPTIWRPLNEFVAFCKSNCVKVGLVTNGYKFSDDTYWHEYRLNPCDFVSVSVKSGNRASFISAVGLDLYDKSMIGIQRIMSLHKTGFSTVYNGLIGKEGLLEIAHKCKILGASSMSINLCSPVLGGTYVQNDYAINTRNISADIISVYPILDELYQGHLDIALFVPLCLFPKDFIDMLFDKGQLTSICHVHNRTGIVFDTNGNVLPCNSMLGNSIAQYGSDFFDSESLLKHLNSPELIENYRFLLRYPSDECSSCMFNRRCKGGCILNWTTFNPTICRAVG